MAAKTKLLLTLLLCLLLSLTLLPAGAFADQDDPAAAALEEAVPETADGEGDTGTLTDPDADADSPQDEPELLLSNDSLDFSSGDAVLLDAGGLSGDGLLTDPAPKGLTANSSGGSGSEQITISYLQLATTDNKMNLTKGAAVVRDPADFVKPEYCTSLQCQVTEVYYERYNEDSGTWEDFTDSYYYDAGSYRMTLFIYSEVYDYLLNSNGKFNISVDNFFMESFDLISQGGNTTVFRSQPYEIVPLSGDFGNGLHYSFYVPTGTLTISGSGPIPDYQYTQYNASTAERLAAAPPWFTLHRLIKEVFIEDGVTGIGSYAFHACSKIENISLPESLTYIHSYALGISNMPTVYIPDNCTQLSENALGRERTALYSYKYRDTTLIGTPGGAAETYCASQDQWHFQPGGRCGADVFWSLDTGGSFTVTGLGAMTDYSSLNARPWKGTTLNQITSLTVGEGVTSLADNLMTNAVNLEQVDLPSTLKFIGSRCFDGCTSLTSIQLPESLEIIEGSYAFRNCPLTSIVFPGRLSVIGGGAFYGCSQLESVTLPKSLETIGDYAFNACTSLSSIEIPDNVSSIGDYAFGGCSNLTRVSIPSAPVDIGYKAFTACPYLTSVYLGRHVASVGEDAFLNCNRLSQIAIPASVTSIGSHAFGYKFSSDTYTRVSGFTITAEAGTQGYFYIMSNNFDWNAGASCGDGVYYIYDNEGHLTIYGEGAMDDFDDDDPPYSQFEDYITTITVESGVTHIGDRAFDDCSQAEHVYLADSITSIGDYAFSSLYHLRDIYLPFNLYTLGEGVFSHCGLEEVIIPSGVSAIPDEAFRCCENLTYVELPEHLRSIGIDAFLGCGFTTVNVPAEVETIRSCALGYDEDYEPIDDFLIMGSGSGAAADYASANGFTYMLGGREDSEDKLSWLLNTGSGTLYISGQGKMRSYTNYETTPWRAYESQITSVIIQRGVTRVGLNAFRDLPNLTTVTCADTVEYIDTYAFRYCSSLSSVDLGDGCTYVSMQAFANCPNLTQIDLGDSMEELQTDCFTGSGLTSVTVPPTIKAMGTDCMGYDSSYNKIPNFTIRGLAGSAAERYATENGFTFVSTFKPAITKQPESVAPYLDTDFTLSVTASGATSYQWYSYTAGQTASSAKAVSGATAPKLTLTAARDIDGNRYFCRVRNAKGYTDSAAATVTINLKPQILRSPASSGGFLNDSVPFRVIAQGEGLTYQWEYSKDDGVTWHNAIADGNQTATLTVPVTSGRNGYFYRCKVTNASGDAFSEPAKLVVLENLGTITINISSGEYEFTDYDVYKLVHTAIACHKEAGDCLNDWGNRYDLDADGHADIVFESRRDSENVWHYYCGIASTNLSGVYTRKSTAAQRQIIPAFSGTAAYSSIKFNFGTPFVILDDPQPVQAFLNASAVFKVAAQGNSLTYQWEYSKDDGSSWHPATASGNKTDTLTVPVTSSRNGYYYRCQVTDKNGKTLTSDYASLWVMEDLGTATLDLSKGPLEFNDSSYEFLDQILDQLRFDGEYTGLVGVAEEHDDFHNFYKFWFDLDKNGRPDVVFTHNYPADMKDDIAASPVRNLKGSYTLNCTGMAGEGRSQAYSKIIVKFGSLQITGQPHDFTGPNGSAISFKVTAAGEGLTYQWYFKRAGETSFSKSTLAAGKTDTFTMTMQDKYEGWQYYCLVTDKYGSTAQSDTVVIHKGAALQITGQPTDFHGVAGDTITFNVTAAGDGLTYQWWFKRAGETAFNKSTVAAGKKATYTMTMADKYLGWQYYCVVTDSHGSSIRSNTVSVAAPTALKITTQPVNYTGAVGSTAKFTVKAQGDGLTYQWYYKTPSAASFSKCTSAPGTTANYSIAVQAKHEGYQFYCIVKDSHGSSVKTNTVKIFVGTPLKITTQPSNFTGAVGATAKLKVVAQGDGLTYQWYCKKTGETSFSKSTLTSATTATLSLTLQAKHDGYQYYCKVKDSHGNTVNSSTVKITVGTELKITTQPTNYTGAVGSTAKFKVVAQGDGLTYQWYYKTPSGTSFSKCTSAPGTTANYSITVQSKHEGYQFYCIVKDSHGNSVKSSTVKIFVGTPLKITTQPVNYTGASGSTATLKVVAQGDGLTYQWYYCKAGETTFSKSTLASGTKATYTMTMQDKHDGWKYYCIVKDSHGSSVKTNTVKLSIGTPLKITTQPTNFTGAVGATAKLKVVAQGDGLTYQWYVKKTGETSFSKSTLTSATTKTLSLTLQAKHEGYKYYCIVKDSHGSSVRSNTVTVHVN